MSLTPMMQQYQAAKAAAGDALLLFRMGDFYELFDEDAKTAARVLGLTLTSREKGENAMPMAGFPHHQLDAYLAKIIAAGMRAAVCEQVEDPKKAKGLVKRELTRVVTPGTVTDDALLDPRESNYLAAICPTHSKGDDRVGLAWIDLSTGRFQAAVVPSARLPDELARIQPAECLVPESATEGNGAVGRISNPSDHLSPSSGMPVPPPLWGTKIMVTRRPDWSFSQAAAREALGKQLGTASLECFGFTDDDGPAIAAAGAVLDYLHETQKTQLAHVDRLLPYRPGHTLDIDESSRRSLEITRTMRDGRREGSLLAVIDRTVTAMGSRLLADWLAAPLTEIAAIDARLDAVGELLAEAALADWLRDQLKEVYDVQRLLARVTTLRATPRDLSFLGRTLRGLPPLKAKLTARKSTLLNRLEAALDLCPELRNKLDAALADDCPLATREGGIIRPGYHAELDSLRELARGGKQWIAAYQRQEIERTGIPSLKVGFNQVFGYYIEVTNAHRDKVPSTYIRKQTIKNAERYITPELKEYEEKVLSADEKAKELEYQLFVELRDLVAAHARRLQAVADVLAQLDVLAGLAALARQRGYCRPKLVEDPVLDITDGRHPVLDVLSPEGTFVPNDVRVGHVSNVPDDGAENVEQASSLPDRSESGEAPREHPGCSAAAGVLDGSGTLETCPTSGHILLITGPNMAGKSTYIRQVALLVLMTQMGSFIPARRATIGIADRIFARVGASDELSRGQSTFMVEMTESARILNTATRRSLVILDEIGRGTSTYDGVSLAWAVVEYLHEHIGCRTLFATHYHELTDLARTLPGVRNLNVAVREWQDDVVFLHKIVAGAADKSYGIHVARLAGVPREVVERAKDILWTLEEEHLGADGRPKLAGKMPLTPALSPGGRGSGSPARQAGSRLQLTLFGHADHPLLARIRELDVDQLTPLEALNRLKQWQEELRER
jgi:DNA mismatch repair protein MutS